MTAPSHWKVVSNAPTPEPEALGDGKARVWRFPTTKRMSTYITAIVAGEYHGGSTPTRASTAHPARPLLPPVAWSSTSTRDELVKLTKQSFEFFEEQFDYPYPFEQVRPALRAGVQHGRDGERRLRDAARRVPPPQPPAALVLRVPRLGHHPRDGAHVVRRPGHHEVVGRPLAQRVVRRVGLLPRARPRPPSSPTRGPASPTPASRPATAPTSCPRPTRSRPTTSTCTRSRSTST